MIIIIDVHVQDKFRAGGGGGEGDWGLLPYYTLIACPKIKWFCLKITWFAQKLPFDKLLGYSPLPPPPPASYTYDDYDDKSDNELTLI